jgi:hypothetical protein
MLIKRIFLGLALTLLAHCGVATAGDAVQDLQLDAAYMVQSQAGDYAAALAGAEDTAAVTQAQESPRTTTRLRSDMRVASAGLVFDRAEPVRSIQRLVPC